MTNKCLKKKQLTTEKKFLDSSQRGRLNKQIGTPKRASDETLEKIYKNYIVKQLDETNERIANTLIKRLTELMESLELIDDGESLEKDLKDDELFKRDVKNILGYITPYLPFVGLTSGGIKIGKYMMKKKDNQRRRRRESRCCI